MKTIRKIFAVLSLLSIVSFSTPKKAAAQVSVSFQLFYDDLGPYGQWVDYPGAGYVWIPNAGAGFSPYSTGGHWVWTEYGWTWVSDYPWGWAPFHYGRWDFDPVYGWLWFPGQEWGPAWVSWRHAPGYYGWAPLGYRHDNDRDDDRWVFVPDRDVDRDDVNRYYVDRSNNTAIMHNSNVIDNKREDNNNHVSYNAGPGREEVQKVTGRDVRAMTIQNADKPEQKESNGQLRIYRPQVQKENANGQRSAPAKAVPLKDVKPAGERQGQRDIQQSPKQEDNRPPQKEQPQPKDNPADRDIKEQPRQENTPKNPADKEPQSPPQQQNTHPDNNPNQQRAPEANPANNNNGANTPVQPQQHDKKPKKKPKPPKE